MNKLNIDFNGKLRNNRVRIIRTKYKYTIILISILIIFFSYGLPLYGDGEEFPFGINNSVYKEFFENSDEGIKYREKYKQSMDMAVELGVKWWRPLYLFEWKNVQPYDSTQWNFNNLDSIVKWSGERELNILPVLITLSITPYWARNKKISYKYYGKFYPPDSNYWDEYETFIKKLIERYDGDGIGDMPGLLIPIKYWEFANEPYGKCFLGTPEQFIDLFKRTCKAIKEADTEAKIVGPCLTSDQDTLQWRYFDIATNEEKYINLGTWEEAEKLFLDSIGIVNIDVISHHIYSNKDKTLKTIDTLRSFLENLGNEWRNKPIWITEMGAWNAHKWDYKTYSPVGATRRDISYSAKQDSVFACSISVYNHKNGKGWITITDTLLSPGDTFLLCDLSKPLSYNPYSTNYTEIYELDTIIYRGGDIIKDVGDTVLKIGDKLKIYHHWIESDTFYTQRQKEYYRKILQELNPEEDKFFFFTIDNFIHKNPYPPLLRFNKEEKTYIPIFSKNIGESEFSIIDTSNKPYPAYNTIEEYIKNNYYYP